MHSGYNTLSVPLCCRSSAVRTLIALVAFLSSVLPSHAADEYVRCVQNQLIALEQTPGKADGLIGPKTLAAATQLKNDRADWAGLQLLPDLSSETARNWCKALPFYKTDLVAFHPAELRTRVRSESMAGPVGQQLLVSRFNDVARFFETRYDIALPEQPVVVAADDSFSMAEMMRGEIRIQNRPELPGLGLALRAAQVCRGSDGTGGLTYYDVVGLCWQPPTGESPSQLARWARRAKPRVGATLAHEYMHYVQFSVINQSVDDDVLSWEQLLASPFWLFEGTATYVGLEYEVDRANNLRAPTLREQVKSLSDLNSSINDLRLPPPYLGEEHYQQSYFAVDLLVRRTDDSALFDYWRSLGAGLSHDAAFETTFGLSLEEFESRFPGVLKTAKAARRFANGG